MSVTCDIVTCEDLKCVKVLIGEERMKSLSFTEKKDLWPSAKPTLHWFCVFRKQVTDYRTPVSGIEPHHLKLGRPLSEVKKVVADQLRGGILVGHDVEKDLKVLGLCHPEWNIRDTAYYPPIRSNPNQKPSLRYLAAEYAGMNIQNGYHCSVRDARAAMMIYKEFEDDWEEWLDESDSSDYSEPEDNGNGYHYDYY